MPLTVNGIRIPNICNDEKNIQVPFEVDRTLLSAIDRVSSNPGECIPAKEKYKIMAIHQAAGLPTPDCDVIDPTLSNNWLNLAYMVLIDSIRPVNWNPYLKHIAIKNDYFVQFITQVTNRDTFAGNIDVQIKFLRWIAGCKFDAVFVDVNDETRAIVKTLRDMVNKNIKLFMLDPHQYEDFFTYEVTSHTTWRCDAIRRPKHYDVGENTLVGLEEFKSRFRAFTFGFFDDFDMRDSVFAGGSIAKMIQADFKPSYMGNSDIDLFVFGRDYDTRKANVQRVIDHITKQVDKLNATKGNADTKHKMYFAVVGSLVTIYVGGLERKFQIISNDKTNGASVLHGFDVSSVQWSFDGHRIHALPSAFHALKYQVSEFQDMHKLQIERLVKQIVNGYNVAYNADTLRIVDISDLLKQDPKKESDLAKILRGLRKGFYPKMIDLDDEDADSDNIALIETDQTIRGTIVTSDTGKIFDTLVVGGNFDRTYDSAMFDQFNLASVRASKYVRYDRREHVRDTLRVVKLFTDIMVVKSIDLTGDVELVLAITDEFKKFCSSLNDTLWPRYTNKTLGRNLGANNEIVVKFHASTIANLHDRHRSPLRTINGRNLDIREELQVGDKIQLVFSVTLDIRANGHVMIVPITAIKHETDVHREPAPMTNMRIPDEDINYDDE